MEYANAVLDRGVERFPGNEPLLGKRKEMSIFSELGDIGALKRIANLGG